MGVMLSYSLDLLGVAAFASYGAYRAMQVRMNLFGVFVCAGVVSMGGGTVREVILHGTPRYLLDYWYVAVVGLAVAATVAAFRHFDRINVVLEILDAVGLGAFALFGAIRAAEAGLGLGGMMLGGALTAVGGGVLCDLLTGRSPQLFFADLSVVPVLLTTVAAWLLRGHLDHPGAVSGLVASAAAIRLLTLRQGWELWRPGAARHHDRRVTETVMIPLRPGGHPHPGAGTAPTPPARRPARATGRARVVTAGSPPGHPVTPPVHHHRR
jgi:uncharacterized membrane protein YeiH